MRRIHKYQIGSTALQVLTLPKGYKILSFNIQNNAIVMWADVEIGADPVGLVLYVAGTGGETPKGEYLDTVFVSEFVFHIYKGEC